MKHDEFRGLLRRGIRAASTVSLVIYYEIVATFFSFFVSFVPFLFAPFLSLLEKLLW